MTKDQLRAKFPHASESFIQANSSAGSALPDAQPQPPVRHEPLAAPPGKASGTNRFHVRIVSRRSRILDPDNCVPKSLVDCLRYTGIIPDDSSQDITLEVSQEKIAKGQKETTLIEVYAP